ncbi:adenylate/guanylate cyclase domain-containing protein [Marinimicrococcus flavescens]|uniref:Adenylate/guanylate cyclase domain-containing protein n=1 Tax=Marinimicrococcus flavescens TaxID=3031815 RepID=A0AAP3XPX5_9PROT|nr:adenylate/guanylate cyclase domain-containing protein [Marinimicrococcus flavescens]
MKITRHQAGPVEAPSGLRERLHGLVGPAGTGELPDRVRRAIALQEGQSEVLVCWVQYSAIATFAVLYWLAPKAFPPDVPFEPVPLALAAYALFTGLRLHLALRRRLSPWFLSLSVVVDISVLMLAIWSFHLQYQAPPGIYVKAPTFMYAFILIALRALRFDGRYVLLAGLATATGWAVLVGFALLDPRSRITHDYRAYMMSYDILLGAEFDKIVSVLMVSLIIALALHRARRLLVSAVREEQAALELSRFVAPEVADRIRMADAGILPGQGVVREGAVLFADLRGFTPLSTRLSPDETMALLGEWQGLLVPLLQRHGGSIDKYLGDGIMASFGAASSSAAPAADALHAIDEILANGEAWRAERAARGLPAPAIGLAAATGAMLFGAVGHGDRLEYTVIGEPVNFAAKLEKHTKQELVRALCPVETLHAATEQGYRPARPLETRARRRIEGVAEPVDLVVLG